MDNDEDLAIAIRNMTIAAERKSSRVTELESQVEALTAEKNSLAQENADMADLIAELEAKVNNEVDVSLLGDEDDDGDNGGGGGGDGGGGGGGDGGGGGGGGGNGEPRKLLPIPKPRVKHIAKRIATGERITVYNCMYIGLYSKDDMYKNAAWFRDCIVDAFKQKCINYGVKENIHVNLDNIPTDFVVVKRKLNEFATLNQREFIRAMFDMLESF